MPLRLVIARILILALLLFSPAPGRADDVQPSDVFLQAFRLLREARQLEAAGDYAGAAAKCRGASQMYDSIARKWPAWMPDMLDWRRKKVRQDFKRLHKRALESPPGLPAEAKGGELPRRGPGSPGTGGKGWTKPQGIAPAPRALTPMEKYKMLQREVVRLRADRDRLLRSSQEQQTNAVAVNRALEVERHRVKQLQTELSAAQAELENLKGIGLAALRNQVDELKKQLAMATESLKEANERTDLVLAEYEKAQKTIAEMTLRQDQLTQQRDEMAAIIKGLQTDESTAQLVTENVRLREQLNAARARIEELEAEDIESAAEIAHLREEISHLRLQLATTKAQNEAYKQRLIELQGSLDETDWELTFNPPAIGNDAARKENQLLRQIISRQLTRQAFRQQKRELIIAELQDLESGSDQLIAQIDVLAAEVPLSEEERAALRAGAPVASAAINAVGPVSAEAPTVGSESVDRKVARFAEAAAYNFDRGRYESAEAHYEDILQFAPQHVESLCNLGVTQVRLNKVEEARSSFERAILADPNSGRAQFLHGVSYFHLGDLQMAIASIEKAIGLEPNDVEQPSFLGVIHYFRGEWDDAVSTLQSALAIQPRHAPAHYNLSLALLKRTPPNPGGALEHYNQAIKLGLPPNERMERYFSKLKDLAPVKPFAAASNTEP